MNNWIPVVGDFEEKDNKLIFFGGDFISQTPSVSNNGISGINEEIGKYGLLLFEDKLSNGSISMKAELEEISKYDAIEILFNYQDEFNFMCAGVADMPAKYEIKSYRNQWNYYRLSGASMTKLPWREFNIKVVLNGSNVELYVNNIKVASAVIPEQINPTNVGVWVRSRSKVALSDIEIDYHKPKAFIISQFDDAYNFLYEQVIKPVCSKHMYDPVRADEVVSQSLVLDDIIVQIRGATAILADITPDNPNVFYELGYAHALQKPVILLCDKAKRERLPFDISGYRTIFYDNTIMGKSAIERQLDRHLTAINILNGQVY